MRLGMVMPQVTAGDELFGTHTISPAQLPPPSPTHFLRSPQPILLAPPGPPPPATDAQHAGASTNPSPFTCPFTTRSAPATASGSAISVNPTSTSPHAPKSSPLSTGLTGSYAATRPAAATHLPNCGQIDLSLANVTSSHPAPLEEPALHTANRQPPLWHPHRPRHLYPRSDLPRRHHPRRSRTRPSRRRARMTGKKLPQHPAGGLR